MKVGRDYAWYVAYSWTYEWLETEERQWIKDRDFDEGRFHCPKKDIKSEVRKNILEELEGERIKDLVIEVTDFYPTTDCEL